MTHAEHIAGEYEFLEAALGELYYLWQTHPDRMPDAASSLPRFMAMLQWRGWQMVDPDGPARGLAPAPRWQFDLAIGAYIAPRCRRPTDRPDPPIHPNRR